MLIRPLAATDDLAALTRLLNAAYAPLAAAGMNFSAATQDLATTRERLQRGHCLVAVADDGALVGTLTAAHGYRAETDTWALSAPWLLQPGIVHLQQFAVAPALQRGGIGRGLVDAALRWAGTAGFHTALLDTAEPAAHLRRWYTQLGWRDLGFVQWPGKHYRSVFMARPLE
jgi:GNAT superfamily N-acetyltransferase